MIAVDAWRVLDRYAPALAERAKSGVMLAFRRGLDECAAVDDAEAKVSPSLLHLQVSPQPLVFCFPFFVGLMP
jgi:hypothetical protein